MPRIARPLTDSKCKNALYQAKGAGSMLFDGGGLYLHLMPTGAKIWRMKYYRPDGRPARLSFGSYPQISLLHARAMREKHRAIIREGKDPAFEIEQGVARVSLHAKNTFEKVAREWFENNRPEWVERHAQNIMNRLEKDIFPQIGALPISSIDSLTVLETIRKIEKRGAKDIAKRMAQYCCQIFNYAIGCGINGMTHNPAQNTSGLLAKYKKEHFKRIPIKDVPELLNKLENHGGQLTSQTLIAAKLLMLTLVRTSELIEAKWEEINFETAEWTICSERMKVKERPPFVVPLSKQAITLFQEQKLRAGNYEYVFPHNSDPKAHMSNCTVLAALYRLGYKGKMTGHGFRSLGVDVLSSILKHPKDVVDKCLAHGEKNKVMSAYFRDPYLEQRKALMQEWADYIDDAAAPPEALKAAA
ncbi:MAG: integrase arm-type DNA-binding domain-containing protein [Alphaproteobacteria bacterium]|nr:integrase arm-type DNA-binding domain-containing protein [Alphaproteobacteria bacterium]